MVKFLQTCVFTLVALLKIAVLLKGCRNFTERHFNTALVSFCFVVLMPREKRKASDSEVPFPSRPSKRKTSVLAKHTAELASTYNKGISPSDIAKIFREKYGYTDDVVNSRTVSDRVHYIKKNGLAKIAPMNIPDAVVAVP